MEWHDGYRCFKCWAKLLVDVAMCNDCFREFTRIHELDRREPDYTMPYDFDHPTALLHLGFLTIEETDEMLQRLRREHTPEKIPKAARSKIGTTNLKTVQPIDRTAAIVTEGS